MKIWPFTRKAETPVQKSLARPTPTLEAIFGVTPSVSGIKVSNEAALRVPAVNSAVRAISEAAATLDVFVVEIGADGTERLARNHPVQPLLSDHANAWTSSFDFIRDLTAAALIHDEGGLAWVNRLADGRAVEIIHMARGAIQVEYDQVTLEPRFKLNNTPTDPANIIQLRGPFGVSLLNLARDAIGTSMALDAHASKLFSRGARPAGALLIPKGMGEESIKAARAAWRATHEGEDTQARTAVLYDGMTFEPFTFASTDAQFIENRKFQILEIARAFRVPPTMLFELDRATWSNTEQMGREFLSYCLEPWLRGLEGALTRALFTEAERGRYAVRFDRDDLTRADLSTRATVINTLIASQTINPNEGRDWLGLPPRAGGDEFRNPNITPAAPKATATEDDHAAE